MGFPVSTISIMILCGIMWISGAAQGELRPTLTSVMANCARVLATHRSHAWAIIQPLFAVAIFTVVFGRFARMPSDGIPYALFAFSALLPWNYFAEAMRRSGTGLVNESDLVRKIYFPRLIIPLAAVIAPLIDAAIAFIMLISGVTPTLTTR